MGDIAAVEWFGQASSGMAHAPETIAVAFANQLTYYRGKTHSAALTDLRQRAYGVDDGTPDPVLGFLKRYESLFGEFDSIFHGEKTSKESLALFNQQLAQGLYIAQTRSDIQTPALQFVQTIRAMDRAGIALGVACNILISGARSQAALMDIFDRSGYKVTVPDPGDFQEVATWDVAGTTDLVAIKEIQLKDKTRDVLVLIDAKSDSHERSSWNFRDYAYTLARTDDPRRRIWNSIVASALEHIGKQRSNTTSYAHATIALHNDAMGDLGEVSSDVKDQLIHSLEKKLDI